MKQCRIILTTECNLKCSYCCNKIPSVQESFKMTTLDQVVEMKYDIYNITGGEITLVPEKLENTIFLIRSNNPQSKIYLYSNGFGRQSIKNLVGQIDGLSIGVHEHYPSLGVNTCLVMNSFIKTRMLIFDNWRDWKLADHIKVHIENFPNRVELVKDSCDNTPEDRFII